MLVTDAVWKNKNCQKSFKNLTERQTLQELSWMIEGNLFSHALCRS